MSLISELRDWDHLAERVVNQWRQNDYEAFPYHHGLFEGRAEACKRVAKALKDGRTPEQVMDMLYDFWEDTLMGQDSPHEE